MNKTSRLNIESSDEIDSTCDLHKHLKILVVEDSKTEQVRLRSILNKLGFNVVLADNGVQALAIMEENPCQLVISDWRMPELNGIELCRQLRASPRYEQIYFILLTGFDSKNDLIAGLDAGADDFITKPISSEELRVRVQAGIRILLLHSDLEEQNKELQVTLKREQEAYDLIQRDLSVAATLQRSLLPDNKSPFPQLELTSMFEPASIIAGDGLGYFKLDEDHLAFYQFDVAGHGIASAMLSFTLSRLLSPAFNETSLLRTSSDSAGIDQLASHIIPPAQVIASLNERFIEEQDCQLYFTMVYAVLNVHHGEGVLCQAGHPHPLVINADGQIKKLGEGGFPVGMLTEAQYDNIVFKLNPGERLCLYSDGIPDCSNSSGEQLGHNRLHRLLGHIQQSPLTSAFDAFKLSLQQWHEGEVLNDDISLLAIDYNGNE